MFVFGKDVEKEWDRWTSCLMSRHVKKAIRLIWAIWTEEIEGLREK